MPERSMVNGKVGKIMPYLCDRAEEKCFRAARAAAELRDSRATFLLVIAINSAFSGPDIWLFPEDLTLLLWLRLGLVNVVFGVIFALSFIPVLARRVTLLMMATVLLYTVFYAFFNQAAGAPPIYVSGIVIMYIGIYAVGVFRYAEALFLGWSGTALHLGLSAGLELMSATDLVIMTGEMAAVNALGMFVLYRLERLRRREFLNLEKIATERSRYHDLLVRILPASIAERMRAGEQHIADRFDEASVLFVDIVGFTRLSARLKPEEIVALLEKVFAAFDELVEKHGLEKIKTIGDAYLVAAGLPVPRADHAEAIADFALDLQQTAHGLNSPDGNTMEIRIGFHSGPLIAGVIGESRFLYDMWGDTVNVASRMESLGMPGKIQVSDEAHDILAGKYAFEPRGTIEVKGRGEMQTWWLSGRRENTI
ncbi:MAG: adenylate/guanylate cyclase domain-containing protein [Rhodospirillaceae bacterium]|nr:adenylate/guanylate cyclase domain-containing protein [Rhodospirillaceae bacterium]MBT6828424.1 adenylate/guanylate cyclase domain-containing protein [Rhodospirillaceae bacterium]MBT7293840.1 adenylate/guanylate cyclase domain-containing protein [Rhodospirillaceae bacterium]